MSLFTDKLNGLNLYDVYGVVVQSGTAELLQFPERKETLSNDWAEHNGKEYDLDIVRFKEKEVTLLCAIVADNDTEFWTKYNAFFAEVTKTGWQQLFISDHGKTYEVFYKKTSGFQKRPKRLKNVEKVFVKFQLTLQINF